MKDLITSTLLIFVMTFILGVLYPLAVWGVGQTIFPAKANGSLIVVDGKTVGSELIGQQFDSPKYFHSRPSAAGDGYDASASGGSNLGPTSKKLIDRIESSTADLKEVNGEKKIPADLVTTSASGLDPHISPAAAVYQIERVARERKVTVERLQNLIAKHTAGRDFGFLGEPRVNVLMLNLALDRGEY